MTVIDRSRNGPRPGIIPQAAGKPKTRLELAKPPYRPASSRPFPSSAINWAIWEETLQHTLMVELACSYLTPARPPREAEDTGTWPRMTRTPGRAE